MPQNPFTGGALATLEMRAEGTSGDWDPPAPLSHQPGRSFVEDLSPISSLSVLSRQEASSAGASTAAALQERAQPLVRYGGGRDRTEEGGSESLSSEDTARASNGLLGRGGSRLSSIDWPTGAAYHCSSHSLYTHPLYISRNQDADGLLHFQEARTLRKADHLLSFESVFVAVVGFSGEDAEAWQRDQRSSGAGQEKSSVSGASGVTAAEQPREEASSSNSSAGDDVAAVKQVGIGCQSPS